MGVAGVGLGLTACGGPAGKPGGAVVPPPVTVQTAVAVLEKIPVTEAVVGTVRPKLEATVAAKIAGRILEVLVVPGQKVEAGDRIAVLEAGELEAARNRAQAALEQSARELDRQRQLFSSYATAKSAFEQAEAAQRMAAASLAEIQTTLQHAIVTAPFAGTVARKLADTGDLAIPGRGIVQLEDPRNLRLEAAVPESLAGKLELGQPITVSLDVVPDGIKGNIGEMAPSADSASRTFMVRIDLPPTQGLRAGLFGRARFPLGETEAVLIPANAVRHQGQMESVFLAVDNKAVLRLVRTVAASPGQVRVLSGIHAGDKVILDPPNGLADGYPLTPGTR